MNLLTLHVHALTAIVATIANCAGGIGDGSWRLSSENLMSECQRPTSEWHGQAQMLDIRAGNGTVHLRSTSGKEIEVRARPREPRHASEFELRTITRGRGVIVCVIPADMDSSTRTSGTSGACPVADRDWPHGRAPAVDMDVLVPEGVTLHASAASDS